jgi:hypothetical protein
MWFSNLLFSLIFNYEGQPLSICEHNLQATIDKEDCELKTESYN